MQTPGSIKAPSKPRSNPATDPSSPWYRQFWPWFILALLGWGVVSSSITLAVAVRNPPQMMTGDYARLGKALVDTHERADRAESRLLGMSGRLERRGGRVTLALAAADPSGLGDSLMLMVQHPTDAGRDRQLVLVRAADGRYEAEEAVAWPARGRLIVSDLDQSWWISSDFAAGGSTSSDSTSGDSTLLARLVPERL